MDRTFAKKRRWPEKKGTTRSLNQTSASSLFPPTYGINAVDTLASRQAGLGSSPAAPTLQRKSNKGLPQSKANLEHALIKPFGQTLKGNVIYLVNLDGLAPKMMSDTAKKANDFFQRLGLNTRVAVAQTKLSPQDFMATLTPNEGVALIVKQAFNMKNPVTKKITNPALDKIAQYNSKFAYKVLQNSDFIKTTLNPEVSSNSNMKDSKRTTHKNVGKNMIAIRYDGIVATLSGFGLQNTYQDIVKSIAFTIIHGAGHNAQSIVTGEISTSLTNAWDHYGGVLTDANFIKQRIQQNGFTLEDFIGDYIYTSTEGSEIQKLDKQPLNNISVIKQFFYKKYGRIFKNIYGANADKQIDKLLVDLVHKHPRLLPNLTYKITMQQRFGKHRAVVNPKLGYIPK